MFDIKTILAAGNVWDCRPYDYGVWNVPFDNNGLNPIIGGTFDADTRTLYVVLANAAQTGAYDRPPLIVTFTI